MMIIFDCDDELTVMMISDYDDELSLPIPIIISRYDKLPVRP